VEATVSILSGYAIRAAVDRGDIVIDPFRPEHVNPASVDLTLGRTCGMYVVQTFALMIGGMVLTRLDSKKDNEFQKFEIEERGLLLEPHRLYLLHTAERVRTDRYVPVLDGKSSLGRLGVQVHMTAGYGDPGFDGQYTLEVTAVYPTIVYAGMRFCQMRFHSMERRIEEVERGGMLYRGSYTGEASMGPVPSRSWKQFEEPSK
jgi:dCTP deaminase